MVQAEPTIGGRFGRVEPRQRVGAYLRRLPAGLERKNGWTTAEHAGAVSPDGMQRLLRTAGWDVDGVRDDLRGYVLDRIGDPAGVFVGGRRDTGETCQVPDQASLLARAR